MSLSPSASPSNPILQGQADSPLGSRLARHFAVGLLAASAPMLSASSAQAGIVHAVVNWTVPNTLDGVYINVQTRETASSGSLMTGWDLNPYSDTSLTWFKATGTGMMRYPGVTTGSAGNLALGTSVDAAGSYGSGAVVVGSAAGNWQLNSVNIFGFRFVAADGLTHYGFGTFQIGSSIAGADRMITNLYYESVAGQSIVVPAPGALALLGVAGLAGARRRR